MGPKVIPVKKKKLKKRENKRGKPEVCQICQKTFLYLQTHIKRQHEKTWKQRGPDLKKRERPLLQACKECGRSVRHLKVHVKRQHTLPVKKRVLKRLERQIELQNKKPGLCPVCGKSFKFLKKHMKQHEESVCDRAGDSNGDVSAPADPSNKPGPPPVMTAKFQPMYNNGTKLTHYAPHQDIFHVKSGTGIFYLMITIESK